MTPKDKAYWGLYSILKLQKQNDYPPMIVDSHMINEYQKAIVNYLELWS